MSDEKLDNENAHSCPIGQSGLMVNPVVAEDGFTYEKANIDQYLETCEQAGKTITSPLTRQVMGTKTFPNLLVKQNIQSLVEKGSVLQEASEEWRKRTEELRREEKLKREAELEQNKCNEALIENARKGDVTAMTKLGTNLFFGKNGFEEDKAGGLEWLKKAQTHEAECPVAAYNLGQCLFVSGDHIGAFYFFLVAANGGVDLGCFALGNLLSTVDVDFMKTNAVFWLKQGFDHGMYCHYGIASEEEKVNARDLLNRLESQGY